MTFDPYMDVKLWDAVGGCVAFGFAFLFVCMLGLSQRPPPGPDFS